MTHQPTPTGDGSYVVWDDMEPMFQGTFEECQAYIREGKP